MIVLINIKPEVDEKLRHMLSVAPSENRQFRYGQLSGAAGIAVIGYGHLWAMRIPYSKQLTENLKLRGHLRKLVRESVAPWHSNESAVWRQFREHAIRMGSSREMFKLLRKLQVKI